MHARVQSMPKLPPHSIESEQSVLGGLLLDGRAWTEVAEKLSAADFYRTDHRVIFEAITALIGDGKACDFLTVTEWLRDRGRLDEAGGSSYVGMLASDSYSIANILSYADIVRARAVLRGLIAAGSDIGDMGYRPDGRDADQLIDEAEKTLGALRKTGTGALVRSTSELVQIVSRRIEEARARKPGTYAGLPTGFVDFDRRTNGLEGGDLMILAARPGMGKTTLALNVIEHVAVRDTIPVAVFSMEMPDEQLMMRMHASVGRVPFAAIRSGQLNDADMDRIVSAQGLLHNAPIHIDCSSGLSPLELRARARRLASKHGIKLIVVDYLQRMTVPGSKENRTNVVTEISNALKDLAMELRVPVIALAQLNRDLERRDNKRPKLSDLRDSGGIEQDADLVAFIYREAYYNDKADLHKAELDIAKQRNGPTGKIELNYQGQFCKFDNPAQQGIDV